MHISTEAKQWAKELYEAGANMAAVNRELAAAMYEPKPVLCEAVRSEFTKLVLEEIDNTLDLGEKHHLLLTRL
jgi:hypothetical protein